MKILSKKEVYRLFSEGAFGNRYPMWNTLEEAFSSDCRIFVMRYMGKAGGPCNYHVRRDMLHLETRIWEKQGWERGLIRYHPTSDDTKLLIQGEVMLSERHLTLYYSCQPSKMRDALKIDGKQVEGYTALSLLRYYLTPNSMEDLELLLDLYPESVIEFSCWKMCVGDNTGRNSIFWEVRNF